MAADPMERVISKIDDAALDPRLWTDVLQSVAKAVGAIGAEYIVQNARTGRIDWANFVGPSAGLTSNYFTCFAAQDRFLELLTGHEGTWVKLSDHLPATEFQPNGWCADPVLKSGVRDIVAVQINTTGSHKVILGVHEGIRETPLPAANLKRLDRLLKPLRRAAEIQLRLRELGWRSAVLTRAFDQVPTGFIVVDAHGFVVEMNELAERVIRRGDGLALHDGALRAARVFETAKLAAAITSATKPEAAATSSRILIGRHHSQHDYILSVSSLRADLGFYFDPMALIVIVDPDARSPKADDLSAYFGLSFAEARLATQLMSGKTLGAIAAETGAAMATLRSQLHSVLVKIKVERQADLLLVLAHVLSSPDEIGGQDPPAAEHSRRPH